MPLSGVGNAASASQLQESKSPRQAFKQLKEAIVAGDVEQAKLAYATVKQHAPTGPKSQDAASTSFDAVGVALDEGDAPKAKVAFGELEDLLRSKIQATGQPVASSAASPDDAAPRAPKRLDVVA